MTNSNARAMFDRIAPALADGRWQDAKLAAEDLREVIGRGSFDDATAQLGAGWDRVVTDADTVMLPSVVDGPCAAYCQADDRRSACCRYAIQLRYADALMVETMRDDRRIFQALCTERDRLESLHTRHVDPGTIAHTRQLIDRYAERLRAAFSVELGCACVTLPSGAVYPCQDHARLIGERTAHTGWSQRGQRQPAAETHATNERRG